MSQIEHLSNPVIPTVFEVGGNSFDDR